jgi:hypothetical protein
VIFHERRGRQWHLALDLKDGKTKSVLFE